MNQNGMDGKQDMIDDAKDNEIKMILNKLNYLENKLNQLTQQFKAHRDRKDIHDKRLVI